MDDPLTLWRNDHAHFSRLLDLLEEQVIRFQSGDAPDYERMLDIVSYLREFPDRFHHPREDVAVGFLVEHEPSLRLPVNRLLQEHRVIAAAGDELQLRINQVLDGALMSRAAVEAAAAIYLTYYRHHLAVEDREILPRAARALTPEQWRCIAEAAPRHVDPVFGRGDDERYRGLQEALQPRRAGG